MISTGIISTIAGNGIGGFSGDGGPAISAELSFPSFVAVDSKGDIYIADNLNSAIRKVTISSGKISTVAGKGQGGYNERNPNSVAVDTSGNIYIADGGSISKINLLSGKMNIVAGNNQQGYSGDGGLAVNANINNPFGLTLDGQGNIYFADYYNHDIRKITVVTGILSTVAGNRFGSGTPAGGYGGDRGQAISANLNAPTSVAVDISGNIYIADTGNNLIRKVTSSTGIISTFAGNRTVGYSGDGGSALSASFNGRFGIAVDISRNVFIADANNNVIRKVKAK